MTPQSPPVAEPKFKVGDKVECVNDGGGKYVRNGHVYTVTEAFPAAGTVAVDGVVGAHWELRFRLSSPAPAPVDETKAPDPLPDVLPTGTKWKAGATEGVFLETSGRIKNEGDGWRWIGHCEWFISPNGDIRKDGRSVRADFVDWPSYHAALRSPPAPPEADRLQSSGCALCGNSPAPWGTLVRPEKFCDECRDKAPGGSIECCEEVDRRKSLAAKDAPDTRPCYECKRQVTRDEDAADPGEVPICGKCKAVSPSHRSPPAQSKPDPYADNSPPPRYWLDEQNRIAATKLDQAKQSLDRPAVEKRYRGMPEREFGVLGRVFRPVSKPLATGHPVTWPSCEGEEP